MIGGDLRISYQSPPSFFIFGCGSPTARTKIRMGSSSTLRSTVMNRIPASLIGMRRPETRHETLCYCWYYRDCFCCDSPRGGCLYCYCSRNRRAKRGRANLCPAEYGVFKQRRSQSPCVRVLCMTNPCGNTRTYRFYLLFSSIIFSLHLTQATRKFITIIVS